MEDATLEVVKALYQERIDDLIFERKLLWGVIAAMATHGIVAAKVLAARWQARISSLEERADKRAEAADARA